MTTAVQTEEPTAPPAVDPFTIPSPQPVDDAPPPSATGEDAPPRRRGPAPDPSRPRSRARKQAAAKTAAAPRANAPRKKAAAPERPDYRGIFLSTLGSIVRPIAAAAAVTENDPLMADCIMVTDAAEILGDGIDKAAVQYPRFGALMERWGQIQPLSDLGAAVLSLVAQGMVNHGRMPAELIPGTRDIVGDIRAQRRAAAQRPGE